MALARNLKPNRLPKLRAPKGGKRINKKIVIYTLIGLAVIFGAYGILNLSRLAPADEGEQKIAVQTGDAPLPKEVKIWINADGGLNMRSEPSAKSEILKIIPNNTELVAIELSSDWYKVEYDGKTGWVHKDYVRTFNDAPASDASADWKSYNGAAYGYTAFYPKDWVYNDYGANKAANLLGYVGFGVQLSDQLDSSNLPPVVIKTTADSKEVVDANYGGKTDVSAVEATISGVVGTKYIYTSSSGVQMTAFVVTKNGKTYILEESGGYGDELNTMVIKFKLS